MDSAAAIIDALNARAAATGRLRAAARESWTHWLDRLSQRPGKVSGAPAEDLVAQLAAREPAAPPPRAIELNRWQAFATLWRQHWQPGSSDERVWRITAGSASFAWHVLLAILLLIVTAMHFEQPRPQDDEAVQIEYIGEGTPAEEGGGPAPSAAATRAEESPQRAAVARTTPPPSPAAATQPASSTTAPAATAPQPLTVSKAVPDASTDFTLPPTTLPSQPVETLRAPVPEVQVASIPERPQARTVTVPSPTIEIDRRAVAVPEVAVRAVPDAVVSPAPSARIDVAVDTPRAAAQTVDVRPRDIPARAPAASGSPATAGPAAASPASPAAGTSPTAGPASAAPSTGVGTGPKAVPAPGSWATPRRGDDWGESTRNRTGNGVFDGDGRPRIGDGPGSASAAHPPGMITDEIKDIDRAGTWLKRKPYPYEPTRWDRLWRPNQTLLEDWVDKGVKQVGIPIPGTNKRIICIISILQLGGGCGISDPNLNEQPATARPPPDVPFKPALQEGNGATWDKDGKVAPPPRLPGLFAPPKSGVPPGATPAKEPGTPSPPQGADQR